MSGFSAAWLSLRAPYDAHARNAAILAAVAQTFSGHSSPTIVDLGCGTGSTLRALAPRLPPSQTWRLIDNDPDLLRHAQASAGTLGVTAATAILDLARDLPKAFDGSIDLIATSALLDLVSQDWLDTLVRLCANRRLPLYAALTYDGRATLAPACPGDADIVRAVNRHQRTDKGFGPALGPAAAAATVAAFEAAGYDVIEARSDWTFAPDDRAIQTEIVQGWAQAARELGDLPAGDIDTWLNARRAALAAGHSHMRVGHVDVFARPIGTR